jgi:hypothetical protein
VNQPHVLKILTIITFFYSEAFGYKMFKELIKNVVRKKMCILKISVKKIQLCQEMKNVLCFLLNPNKMLGIKG